MAKDYIVVLVTAANLVEAQQIAGALTESKMAACVNIVPEIHSYFWWQGKLDTAHESLLIVKSRSDKLQDVINIVKSKHNYETPEIIALPIIGGNDDYLNWIDESLD
jgi:periplasmic divalent cation tolerance protein